MSALSAQQLPVLPKTDRPLAELAEGLPPPWEREPAPTEPWLPWEPRSSQPYPTQSSRPKLPTTRKLCSSHQTMNSSEQPTVDIKNVKRHINMSLEAAIPCCISFRYPLRKSFFKEKTL